MTGGHRSDPRANVRWMGGTGALRDEAQTRIQLIDPALHARGWTEDLIRREETLGTVEIVDGRPRRPTIGRTDYTLRVKVARGRPARRGRRPRGEERGQAPDLRARAGEGLPRVQAPARAVRRRHQRAPVGAVRPPHRDHDATPARWPSSRPRTNCGPLYENAVGLTLDHAARQAAAHAVQGRRGVPPLLPGRRHPRRRSRSSPAARSVPS